MRIVDSKPEEIPSYVEVCKSGSLAYYKDTRNGGTYTRLEEIPSE
jgi:hypothetical protein